MSQGKLVASRDYLKAHDLPETLDKLVTHQAFKPGSMPQAHCTFLAAPPARRRDQGQKLRLAAVKNW